MSERLLLIPTDLERKRLQPRLEALLPGGSYHIETCGFGLVAAAARTSMLLAQKPWSQVLLVGIAGAYGARVPVGSAIHFQHVRQWGIGVGEAADFQSAEQLGWAHWLGTSEATSIGDVMSLDSDQGHELLSVCAASQDRSQASIKMKRHENADAEDMEGFGVAMACKLSQVPINIVRGISNIAGDRAHENWKINESLDAAASLAASILLARS